MITLAKDGMRTDLERIWRLAMEDDSENIGYFFDNRYNPNQCAVYVDEAIGRPVAMLHMLEAYLTEDSEIIPAQYIYAAATRPDYQGRGIMHQLLDYSRRCAQVNEQVYRIIVPHSREQFKALERYSFYRCFKHRNVFMTRSDLAAISDVKKNPIAKGIQGLTLNLNDIHSVRRDVLVDREGFVTWDFQATKYSVGIHEHNGGSVITATNGFEAGYAFCMPRGDGSVLVSELISHPGFEARLIRRMLKLYTQDSYEFRLPVYNEFFSLFGDIEDYAMISSVSGKKPINILTLEGTHTPYFGLALE